MGRYQAGIPATMAVLFLLLAFLPVTGCGGGSSTSNGVAQVSVAPQTVSMVNGDVVTVVPSAVSASNAAVTTVFTFNSSNSSVVTVSPSGQLCGGVWDSVFVVCKGTDAAGNPITGTATITATAGGVTSGPVLVSVHESVTSVSVDSVGGCFSVDQTHQFTARAFHNGTDITTQIGTFSWSSSIGIVASVDGNGLATALNGGLTGIVASVGNTSSPAVDFKSCMPVLLVLHIAGDPAGGLNFSKNMNVADTQALQLDIIDENAHVTANAPFTLVSNNSQIASVAGETITAQAPGGAGIIAACSPPICGDGLNIPVYSNVFNVTVNGTSSTSTTVYATTTFSPPLGNAIPLLPIDVSQNPPKPGTVIALPGVPNSMIFTRDGTTAYIGTNVGLALLDATAQTATLATPVPVGVVLAVSPDGSQALISNSANDPTTGAPVDQFPSEQRLWLFNKTSSTITTFVVPGIVAASFNDDGFKAFGVGNNGNFAVLSPVLTEVNGTTGGTSVSVAALASGPFFYVANSAGLQVLATCNNTQQAITPPTNSSTIQLVGSAINTDQIVAVDSTGIDIENVATSSLIAPTTISATNCVPNVVYGNRFVDFGVGPFTAHQLIIATNDSHIAVLADGINSVLTAIPGGTVTNIPLAGAGSTQPLTGSMTPDGSLLWVGVGGTNTVHRINLVTGADEVQIPTTFLKQDGSPAPPNLVAIKPK
ncbi:MAG TPA: hypothetical protein VGH51_06295 [Candidatus Angelobacter sp.]